MVLSGHGAGKVVSKGKFLSVAESSDRIYGSRGSKTDPRNHMKKDPRLPEMVGGRGFFCSSRGFCKGNRSLAKIYTGI